MISLAALYQQVARRIDGATLVREALAAGAAAPAARRVIAVGKAALPMLEGWAASDAGPPPRALVVAPPARPGALPALAPPWARLLVADHPQPTARSVAAAEAVREAVAALQPADHLVVLLSGGGSALLATPAPGLTLEDKRAAVAAVARGGATIGQLNTVRKHLSAIKGGRLALATPAAVTVLALSDVVGNDPATIASGPFAADPTTFAEALALLEQLAPAAAPAAVRDHLARGAAGAIPETPKPGDPRLARVRHVVVAGPERVAAEARAAIAAAGATPGVLALNTEESVETLAAAYVARARGESAAGARGLVLVGNGEPRMVVTGDGRGGRATHLALLVARGIAGMSKVAFLAAGTDDRDGSADACGAVVDGHTWAQALARGLDPGGAIDRCDSAHILAALGVLVRGPGRSNLNDLHLLSFSADEEPAEESRRTSG